MLTKQDVQARVLDYMRQEDLTETEMARLVRVPQATFNRMLKDDPTYKGTPKPWRKLAQFAPLHLNEADVLAALGHGPSPDEGAAPDPWALFERAMAGWELSEDKRIHLRRQIGYLLGAPPQAPTSGP